MRKTLRCITSALMLIAAMAQSSACVDVALVLAVDGSGSINDEEYAFQKSAIAAAFRDNAVLSAMRNAGVVAVAAVFWGDGDLPSQRLGWFVIEGGEGAEPFAREIENNQRIVSGLTGLGSGIWSALDLLSDPRCLIPGFDGALFSFEWKEALWARFYTAAPRRQRQSVEQYTIVKRA